MPAGISEAKEGGDKDLGGKLHDLVPCGMEEVRGDTIWTHIAYN